MTTSPRQTDAQLAAEAVGGRARLEQLIDRSPALVGEADHRRLLATFDGGSIKAKIDSVKALDRLATRQDRQLARQQPQASRTLQRPAASPTQQTPHTAQQRPAPGWRSRLADVRRLAKGDAAAAARLQAGQPDHPAQRSTSPTQPASTWRARYANAVAGNRGARR